MLQAAKIPGQTAPPEHARGLEELVLTNEHGQSVRLGDLWRDRPAVLIFLRHYG